jgi:opacity protein-like surface antigen
MLKRLILGLVIGMLVGAAAAAALVSGLHVETFTGDLGPLIAYGAAAATGVLTGLVAGKPIWASDARIEAGLKAFFGALLAAGGMFALRQWAQGWSLDLSALHAGGPAPVGALPAASLPLIGLVLGGFFELDNSGGAAEAGPRKRVAGGEASSKATSAADSSAEDEDDPSPAATRRARR